MIDRTRPILLLSRRWLLRVTGCALAITAALFVGAAGCWTVGAITYAACCLWIALVAAVMIVLTIWPVFLGGLVIVAIARREQNYRVAFTVAVAIGLTIWICWKTDWPSWCWQKQLDNFTPTFSLAEHFWQRCCRWARVLIRLFFEYRLWWYAIGVAVAGYTLTGVALVCLLLTQVHRGARRVFRNVRFRCPTCGRREPRVRCGNCQNAHADLVPSRYGIWTAVCAHCNEKLPTTVRRQVRLEKVCGYCHAACHPELGCFPEYHIAVVGAADSGKSVFLAAVLDFLNRQFCPETGHELTFAGPIGEKEFHAWTTLLRNGQVLPPTPRSPRPTAFTVAVKKGTRGCLLYFYDASGLDIQEGAAHGEGLAGHDFHAHIDAVILTVDPWAEQGLRAEASGNPNVKAARYDAHYVLSRMIAHWERVQGVSAEGRLAFPLAVAVTKMDVAGLAERVGVLAAPPRKTRSIARAARQAVSDSRRVRDLLEQSGSVDLLRLLESHFRRVRYFAVSSLGRTPDAGYRAAFQSRGTFGPLVWLWRQIGALPDRRGPFRPCRFSLRYLGRCLRGKEGGRARLKLLGATAAVLLAIAGISWSVFAVVQSDKLPDNLREFQAALTLPEETRVEHEKQMAVWRPIEKEYQQLMSNRQFADAAKQLTRIASDLPELDALKEDFRERSLEHLKEHAKKAAPGKDWESARQTLQTFINDPSIKSVLPPRDLAEFEGVKHELEATVDKGFYNPLRKELTQSPEAIQTYLTKAPLRTMSREVEALRVYKQAITEPLRIEARILWGANCPDYHLYQARILADNQVLFDLNNLKAYPKLESSLGTQSVPRSTREAISFRISVGQEGGVTNWSPEKGETSVSVSMADLGKGKEVKLSGTSGNKVLIRSPNAVVKPIMPVWRDQTAELPQWWSVSIGLIGGVALLIASACRRI